MKNKMARYMHLLTFSNTKRGSVKFTKKYNYYYSCGCATFYETDIMYVRKVEKEYRRQLKSLQKPKSERYSPTTLTKGS